MSRPSPIHHHAGRTSVSDRHMTYRRSIVDCANTLGSVIVEAVQRWPNAEAVVLPEWRGSFGELNERLLRRAYMLRRLNLLKGDRIGVLLDDSADYLELILGAALVGVVPVLFNEAACGDRFEELCDQFAPQVFFVSEHGTRSVDNALDVLHKKSLRVEYGLGFDGAEAYLHSETQANTQESEILSSARLLRSDDPLAILFSAGVSSGTPEVFTLSHHDVLANLGTLCDRLRLKAGSRLWTPLHMFQVGFLQALAATLTMGATLIVSDGADTANTVKILAKEGVSHAYPIYANYIVPVVYDHNFFVSDCPELTHVVLLGPMTLLRRVQVALPHCSVMNCYGGVEHGGTICMPFDNDPMEVRLGAVGHLFPGYEMRIVDPQTEKICTVGQTGEIQVLRPGAKSSPNSGGTFTTDGWLRTSDVGSLNSDGVLQYHGRLSEVLNVRGRSISSSRIEAVLCEHPAVLVAQVVSTSGTVSPPEVVGFVQLRPGHHVNEMTLLEACRQKSHDAGLVDRIRFVDEWPMSASKIQKQLLVKLAEQDSASTLPPRTD